MSVHKIPVRLQADGKTLCGICGYYVHLSQVVGKYHLLSKSWYINQYRVIKQAVAICERCV